MDATRITQIIRDNALYQCLECGKCSAACPRMLAGKQYSPRLLAQKLISERDDKAFTDHFLSMREFKCVEGRGEILCHVPYPYPQPGQVTATDLAWLEHALLFLYKLPGDFGAKLWNGIYFRLQPASGGGLVGTPQAIDLNLIGAPPARPEVPPYGPARRDDIRPASRWFERLTIE